MKVRSKWLGIVSLCAATVAGAALIAAGPGNDHPDHPKGPGTSRGNAPGNAPAKSAAGKIGQPAPAWTLTGVDGKTYKSDDFKGKIIVLEWFNPECPYVVAAHESGSLKGFGSQLQTDGIAFFAINSAAPGKQGHGTDLNKSAAKAWGIEYPVLIDEAGTTGKAYGATNTPHMFVIAADGTLVYAGAIDDTQGKKGKTAGMNYVQNAITMLKASETVSPATTKAFGCNVKYGG